jgi:carbon storage regulator
MLALTRKVGESIVIGDNVEVTIISITGDQIKLGIDAPRSISIHRKEIFLQIQEENKAANASSNLGVSALKDLMGGKKKLD